MRPGPWRITGEIMSDMRQLQELFNVQRLAVLGTQSQGQPYNCLVAFAGADDLKYLLFATKRDTRKYREVIANPRVAILIDSRSDQETVFSEALAVTALGTASEIAAHQRETFANIYVTKHPQLEESVHRLDVALLRIDIDEYVVARFSDTRIIKP